MGVYAIPTALEVYLCTIDTWLKYQTSSNFNIIQAMSSRAASRYTINPANLPPWGTRVLPLPFTTLPVPGVQPNVSYQVFCYAQDWRGNCQITNTQNAKTPDNTAPVLNIASLDVGDFFINVSLNLRDPGNSYPATGRCIATIQDSSGVGLAPQAQDKYFEHRYWRLLFNTDGPPMDQACLGRYTAQNMSVMSMDGTQFSPLLYFQAENPPPVALIRGLPDVRTGIIPFVPADVSVPLSAPWFGIDFMKMNDVQQLFYSRGVLTLGDLTISLYWNGNPTDLDLFVDAPNGDTVSAYANGGFGTSLTSCQSLSQNCSAPLESVIFPIVPVGTFQAYMAWRSTSLRSKNIDVTLQVRDCELITHQYAKMNVIEDNYTFRIYRSSGNRRNCARLIPSGRNRQTWQSSALVGSAVPRNAQALDDRDLKSCMVTGGAGRVPPDTNAFWRMDLGQYLRLDGITLYGDNTDPTAAQMVDVWMSNQAAKQATQGVLCAQGVVLGNSFDSMGAPVPVKCQDSAIGSTLWVVPSASQQGLGLTLCEIEYRTSRLRVVYQAMLSWGKSGSNISTGAATEVCGSTGFRVQYSDDARSWTDAWMAFSSSRTQNSQVVSWNWWSKLLQLPFYTIYYGAGVKMITIPELTQNTTYDVFCWAGDSVGNSQSQQLLATIQATTNLPNYPGANRRLQSLANPDIQYTGLKCTPMLAQLLPCQENVVTPDTILPLIQGQGRLVYQQQQLGGYIMTVFNWVGTWNMYFYDGSCQSYDPLNPCNVTCGVGMRGQTQLSIDTQCKQSWCIQQTWTNGVVAEFNFTGLAAGVEYLVQCKASDPFGNTVRRNSTFLLQAPVKVSPPSPPTVWNPPTEVEVTAAPSMVQSPTTAKLSPWPPPASLVPAPAPTPVARGTTTWDPTGWLYQQPRATPAPIPDPSWMRSTTPAAVATVSSKSTTEAPTTIPAAFVPSPSPQVAPVTVKAVFSLGASTAEAAQALQLPSAVAAMTAALRSSLSLSPQDTLQIQGIQVVAPAGQSRRLSGVWTVQVAFAVTTSSQQASSSMTSRINTLSDSSAAAPLQQALSLELSARGVAVAPVVLGASVVQGSSPGASQSTGGGYLGSILGFADTTAAPTVATTAPSGTPMWLIALLAVLGVTLMAVAAVLAFVFLIRKEHRSKSVIAAAPEFNKPTVRHIAQVSPEESTKAAWPEPMKPQPSKEAARATTPQSVETASTSASGSDVRATALAVQQPRHSGFMYSRQIANATSAGFSPARLSRSGSIPASPEREVGRGIISPAHSARGRLPSVEPSPPQPRIGRPLPRRR